MNPPQNQKCPMCLNTYSHYPALAYTNVVNGNGEPHPKMQFKGKSICSPCGDFEGMELQQWHDDSKCMRILIRQGFLSGAGLVGGQSTEPIKNEDGTIRHERENDWVREQIKDCDKRHKE